MVASSISTRHWITKRAARECGANAIMFQQKQRPNDNCPFCGESESVLHVYKCQDPKVKDVWRKCTYELETDLQHQQTDPDLILQLCQGLLQWQQGIVPDNYAYINQQTQIGWDGVLEGCLGNHWVDAQGQFYTNNSIQKSGAGWAELVIRKLWKIAWSMWEHRNTKEHSNDIENETNTIRAQVDVELARGGEGLYGSAHMFTEQEIEKVKGSNLAYQRAWLRNVKVRRAYNSHQAEGTQQIQRMRRFMQRFLSRG
jgi:hypothetical protein